jgi:hypothetical protein
MSSQRPQPQSASSDPFATIRGRIGGLALAAQRDPRQYTAAARKRFLARFEDQVDPERRLPEAERERRTEAARRQYFTQLAYRSAKARKAKVQRNGN